MDRDFWFEVMGWCGAMLFAVAYALIASERLKPSSALYHLINIAAGVLFLVVNTLYYHAMHSACINVLLLCVGTAALLRRWNKKATAVNDDPS